MACSRGARGEGDCEPVWRKKTKRLINIYLYKQIYILKVCYDDTIPCEGEPEPLEALKREIMARLEEEQFWERRNRKWNQSEYTVRKNQLFRRMQMEKNEKEYQDCLCRVGLLYADNLTIACLCKQS